MTALTSHQATPTTPVRPSMLPKSVFLRHAATLAIAMVLIAPPADAQNTFTGISGGELRHRGDTIWMTRDTTMSQLVLRGDTATRTRYVNGSMTNSSTYVQRGDVAELISSRDADGTANSEARIGSRVPIVIVLSERQMLEQAIRTEQMQARMAGMSRGLPAPDASPASPRQYRVSANTRIVHHRDTVRYVRGCAAAPPVDTTLYVLFAADSVQRRSPNPRTFDRHMASAIRGDMSTSLTRERVAGINDGSSASLPSLAPWPCEVK